MRLAGKSALVTGAASGIGKAVVATFRREGAEVIAADLSYCGRASLTADAVSTLCLDVSKEDDWQRVREGVARLDVLVAFAGISEVRPIPETGLADWRRVMDVNLDGVFLSVKYGVEQMRKGGGAIVLVGSASGVKASAGASAYCASKAAVRMLVKTAALEFKDINVRVNCVSPAAVVTPMWQKMPFWVELVKKHGSEEGAWSALGGIDPAIPSIQRMAFPEEVAEAIVFLSCDESAHITGIDLLVDGGYSV